MASPAHFDRICTIIEEHRAQFDQVVVVISAMQGMTDQLIASAHQISSNPASRELDLLISIGERMSMTFLAMALHDRKIPAISLTGSQSGIITTGSHTEAHIVDIRPYRIEQHLSESKVVIVAGFQGVSLEKEVTTLGRGGSDTTAVALAAALGAEAVHFYKDVDGVYSKDPKVAFDAQHFKVLSYKEALKIVDQGAQILSKRCLDLALKNQIPLKIFSYKEGMSRYTHVHSELVNAPDGPVFEVQATSL